MTAKHLSFAFALLGTACTVGPEPVAPPPSAPDRFLTTLDLVEGNGDGPWWSGFEDPALDDLIRLALAQNLDLEAAEADLRATVALLRAARSDRFPVFDGGADGQFRVTSDGDRSTSLALGGAFAFDADLSGRITRSIKVAEAQAIAAAFTVADQRRLLTRAVGREYIEYRRAESRLDLLATSLQLQEDTLEIVTARFDAGLSPALDVDRSAADLARTRAQEGPLRADRQDAVYALSVLTRQPPSNALPGAGGGAAVPTFTAGPGLDVPLDVVRRRPDLRVAEARLVAALAQVGVETADLYPSLRLPGSIVASSASSGTPRSLVTANLSALLDIPLFDAGRRRAEVDAQTARADAALAAYEAVVLEILRDVESALVRIAALQDRLADLDEAVARNQAAYRQLEALYREGLADFIDVLDSQRNLIASREDVVDTRADLSSAIIDFYTATGLASPAGP